MADTILKLKQGGTGVQNATALTGILDNVVGDSGSGGTKGLVPAPSAGDAAANKFLKADGTWVSPSGSGDVVGPASSTDNAIARFDSTTGKLLQNSGATIDDSGNIAGNNLSGTNTGDQTASTIDGARISGSTYSTVQDMQDVFHSAGETSGGLVSDDADGTITVAAGTGLIRATNSDVAELLFTDWSAESGANVNLVDNALSYIYVEYNAGSPQVIATTTKRTDRDWETITLPHLNLSP